MAQIVDGNKIAGEILADLKDKVIKLKSAGISPRLVVVLVGEDPASVTYTKKKREAGEPIGIVVEIKKYSGDVSQEELIKNIKEINEQQPHGIIVQLPLPKYLDKQKVLDAIDPFLDVDCLTSVNKQKLTVGEKLRLLPPAASAILKILDFYRIELNRMKVLLVGSGDLVGRPLAALLRQKKVGFELANSKTENLSELAARADVIITGVGKPGLIHGGMVKNDTVIIDAATSESETGELSGDVDFESVSKKARLISPVPGGVGPVTVAMLLNNVVDSALDSRSTK